MLKKLFLLLMVMCVALVFTQVGCSEEEEDASLQNVWKITREYTTNDITGEWEIITYPITCDIGGGTETDFIKFSSTIATFYWKIVGNDTIPDGVYYCPDYAIPYTVSGNTIRWADNTTSTYSISGDTLKITDPDGTWCEFTKASESDIANAIVDCE